MQAGSGTARLGAVKVTQVLRELIRRPRLLLTLLVVLLPLGALKVWLHNPFLTGVLAVVAFVAAVVIIAHGIPQLREVWFPADRE